MFQTQFLYVLQLIVFSDFSTSIGMRLHVFPDKHACLYNFFISLLLLGTLPVIMSRLVKINHTSLFVCNATGLPTPRVTIHKVIGGVKHVINSHQVPISADSGQRSYYCVAQNEFGSSFGKTVKIYGM